MLINVDSKLPDVFPCSYAFYSERLGDLFRHPAQQQCPRSCRQSTGASKLQYLGQVKLSYSNSFIGRIQ